MKREVCYRREVETALFQGKEITVEHLIPILSPEEKTRRTREIERQLYEIFQKYQNRF